MARRSTSAMRNIRTAEGDAAKFTTATVEKTAVSLFRWATTDHYGMGKELDKASRMGFFEGLKYALLHF